MGAILLFVFAAFFLKVASSMSTSLSMSVDAEVVAQEWEIFKLEHGKAYTELENDFRFSIFMSNWKRALKHNRDFALRRTTFKMGLNKYADLTPGEYPQLKGLMVPERGTFNASDDAVSYISANGVRLPPSINWVDKGAVTEIKDQGMCGSCWAFSTTGSLEGQHFRATDKLVSLSEQNLIDCSSKYGNEGCDGGWMDRAFKYIEANGGIDTEDSYPYVGSSGRCRYEANERGATEKSFVDIPKNNEAKLLEALATIGPISVAIDASRFSFQLYQKGIYNDPKCSSDIVDHAVLIVGYGTDNRTGTDYWLIKNSWGTTWGEQGYMRMMRNNHNFCCIACFASYPLV